MIVVTGATGHIGNVLVRLLLRNKNESVRVLIPKFENSTSLEGLAVEKVEGDVLNLDSLIRAFQGVEIVYHLAAIVSIMPGKNKMMSRVNVEGTANVIKACLACRVRRLVYTSSIHALGNISQGKLIDESFPFDIDNAMGEYDRSKAQASLKVLEAVKQGLDVVIICPTGVIGPYDFKPSQIGKFFLSFAKKKLKAYIAGAFDFVDVRDVALGHIMACEKGVTGEKYILSGQLISIDGIMSILQEVTGLEPPRLKIPVWLIRMIAPFTSFYYRLKKSEPLFTSYSIKTLMSHPLVSHDKASQELNYFPRSIKESISDTINWFRQSGKLQLNWPLDGTIEILSVTP